MRDTITRKVVRPAQSRLSKRDTEYESIQEYFHNIKIHYSINTKPFNQSYKGKDWKDFLVGDYNEDITEEQFLDFLDVLERACKDFFSEHWFETEYAKINDFNSWCNVYSRMIDSYNGMYYRRETKEMETSDRAISSLSGTVMALNMYDLTKARGYINEDLWKYCIEASKIVFQRAAFSKLFGVALDFYQYHFIEACHGYNHWEEEFKEQMNNHQCGMALAKICKHLLNPDQGAHDYGEITIDLKVLNESEKRLYKACKTIIEFDPMTAKYFMDIDDYKNMSFEDHTQDKHWKESIEQYGYEVPISEFYNGYYVITYDNHETDYDILNSYVDYINSYENEMWWSFAMSNRVVYSKDKVKTKFRNKRQMLIDYYNSFSDFNNILQKAYELRNTHKESK